MLTISIILIIVSILLVIYAYYTLRHSHTINEEVIKCNQNLIKDNQKLISYNSELSAINKSLKEENENLDASNHCLNTEQKMLNAQIEYQEKELQTLQATISSSIKAKEELSQKAFENYCAILEKQYDEYEEEYDMYKDALETSYSNRQLELIRELDETQKDLDQLKATRAAAIQAITREKEIEQKQSFYCLQIPDVDLKDISVLETIAPKLNKPRTLYMLIWTTFFRTPMNILCANVIGNTTKSGIYKITNIKTKECYIGQAVDLATRWKEHAKFGLQIDAPAGNKLYKAMIEYGIWNFSWEVLEEVLPANLNEKEDYYIQLYDSINYGYNSIKAPRKGSIK